MFPIFFLLFIVLSLSLIVYPIRDGILGIWLRRFRIFLVIISAALFTYFFIVKSLTQFSKNSLTVQIINDLPLPLDFYIVKINSDKTVENKFETRNVGNVRSNFFRIDYLDMKSSEEFWVAGFMGKKNLVYFSQHFVPNKNEDQIIEIHNYNNQSAKLSAISKDLILEMKHDNMKTAIWITLDLLLLFLNFTLLFKKTQ